MYELVDILLETKHQLAEMMPNAKVANGKDAMTLHTKIVNGNFDMEETKREVLYHLTRRLINLYYQYNTMLTQVTW